MCAHNANLPIYIHWASPQWDRNVKVFQDTFERPFENQFGDYFFFLIEGLVLFRM